MSRAGASATRQAREFTGTITDIADKGLLVAATERYAIEENQRVEHAEKRLLRILAMMGIPADEPFILEDFESHYPPHQRVCVRVEGLIFNHWQDKKENEEGVQLIVGRCSECGDLPALKNIKSIADIAYIATAHGQGFIERYKCYACSRKR